MILSDVGNLEPRVGGLDKSYRLHKWLGIAALVMAIAHWIWVSGPDGSPHLAGCRRLDAARQR